MLYVTPFGELYDVNAVEEPEQVSNSLLHEFWYRGLNCGIVIRKGCEDGNITKPNNICGMGVDLCTTLAASIWYGNADAVNITTFEDEEGALVGLANKSMDVLFGIEANLETDFGVSAGSGVTFSMPYLYGNETGR
jgi:hypothetical protein